MTTLPVSDHGGGGIGGAVIDDEHFDPAARLCDDRLQACRHVSVDVIRRNENAQPAHRFIHGSENSRRTSCCTPTQALVGRADRQPQDRPLDFPAQAFRKAKLLALEHRAAQQIIDVADHDRPYRKHSGPMQPLHLQE